jgi:hypothetical protein
VSCRLEVIAGGPDAPELVDGRVIGLEVSDTHIRHSTASLLEDPSLAANPEQRAFHYVGCREREFDQE